MNSKLAYAIAAVLGGNAAGLVYAAPAPDTDAASDQLEVITVTAQRRTENMQDVPITIQALTSEMLAQLDVPTFNDFVKYLPNVTVASFGPGMNNIYMRGLSVGGQYAQGSGGVGSFPNVAVYLDEQSAQ
ncbi:MAG TPA: TonB-dependent receptor plug domain-containing protein, partial [Candidatus Acidoferrum sp.]|nr:TonB-dependent receptor plug domain-containing protein [Candidatus Acidoferrum sp.]